MAWVYVEREQFVRACEKLGVSEKVREAIRNWAPTVSNKNEIPSQKLVYRTPHNRYEAWNARIPNPDSNKGKRGGYRLVFFLDLTECSINLDLIEERDALGFGKERPKAKQKYNAYVAELKGYLDALEQEARNGSI